MSNMNGNPHAEQMEAYGDPRNSLEAEATLALAYEQRTANLIAVQAMALTVLTSGSAIAGATTEADLQRMSTTIEERLGLNGDTK